MFFQLVPSLFEGAISINNISCPSYASDLCWIEIKVRVTPEWVHRVGSLDLNRWCQQKLWISLGTTNFLHHFLMFGTCPMPTMGLGMIVVILVTEMNVLDSMNDNVLIV